MAMRLYDLTSQYVDLIDLLEQDPDNESLQAMLNGMEGAMSDKIDATLGVRNSYLAEEKALKDEAKRLLDRAASRAYQASRVLQLVENSMNYSGVQKVNTAKFTAWIQANPPSVQVGAIEDLPPQYVRTVPETKAADKNAIKAALQAGEVVPGCRLEQSLSLRVR